MRYKYMDITNFSSKDANIDKESKELKELEQEIHIRVKKRNRRKCTTTIENLELINNDKKFLEVLVKDFRIKFKCAGTVKKNEDNSRHILLFGDHRKNIKEYLIKNNMIGENKIKIHGF